MAPEVKKHKTSRLKLKIEEDYGNSHTVTQKTNTISQVSNYKDSNVNEEERTKRVDIVLVNSNDCDIEL